MKTLQCIAVDDEPLALKLVEAFIIQTPFLQLAASFDNAVDAMEAVRKQAPDLIFLDINMPNLSGMELARLLQEQGGSGPKIVFTTAYNHYAIEGYKVNAIDYLLKPFSYEEFLRAANKGLELLTSEKAEAEPSQDNDHYLFLKVEYQWVRVVLKEILYIESLKDYVKVHFKRKEDAVVSLISLKAMEEKLNPAQFMRINRSYIIALDQIEAISKNSIFINKFEISVGEQYKDTFRSIIDKWIN